MAHQLGSTVDHLGVAASEQVNSRLQQAGTECHIELRLSDLAVSANELYKRIACCPVVHRVLKLKLMEPAPVTTFGSPRYWHTLLHR